MRVGHVCRVASPSITLRVKGGLIRHLDGALGLDELNTKTLGDVPCNVAVHEPHSRVVCWEGDQEPTQTGKNRSVTAGRVGKVQGCSAR